VKGYLFSRADGHELDGLPPEVVAGQMFFDLWATRQHPFADITTGDTMLLFDTHSRRLIWELRAAAITRERYDSIPHALDRLRESYGLLAGDLNTYIWSRPAHGWLLAWAAEIVRPLDIPMSDAFRMTDVGGRNGYVRLSAIPSEMMPDLPPPSDDRPIGVPLAYAGGSGTSAPMSRYIPAAVRRAVWDRDRGACVECGRTSDEIQLHIDHRYPHSRGGSNELNNLQLLCRDHNLRKSARVLRDVEVPDQLRLREAVADRLAVPRSTQLGDLVAQLDDPELVLDVLLEEAAGGAVAEVEPLLGPHLPEVDLVTAAVALQLDHGDAEQQARARRYADELWTSTTDDHAKSAAALVLAGHRDGQERIGLLQAAAVSPDYDVEPEAQLLLADEFLRADDERSAVECLSAAYERGDRSIRPIAALSLYELRRNEVDETDLSEEELSKREQLLRVALGGDGDTRATAALYLAGLLEGRAEGAVIDSLLEMAKQDAQDPELRTTVQQILSDVESSRSTEALAPVLPREGE